MPNYFGGLVEGFQGRREEEYTKNAAADAARRGQEGKIFEYLLNSGDPEMRALAMSGMFESAQPGKRKGGLGGYLGEVQGGEFYPRVLARMNMMVPDEGVGGGPAPPTQGSAGMSTNQMTRPGSAPPQLPPQPPTSVGQPPGSIGPDVPLEQGQLGPQGDMGGMPMPPPAPPPQMERRGTGVPTAGDIARANAQAGMQGRLDVLMPYVTPENQERLAMGLGGAPPPSDSAANGPLVVDPADPTTPIPTIRHRDGRMTMLDGAPVPPGFVGYVRPQTGGSQTTRVPDTPAMRLRYKIPPSEPSSGYFEIMTRADGTETWQADTVFPPADNPSYFTRDAQGNLIPVYPSRGGQGSGADPSAPPRDETPVKSEQQLKAAALLRVVTARIRDLTAGGRRLPALPGRDGITRDEAQKLGLPFQTYAEAEMAAGATPPVSRQQQTQGGTLADQIRQFVQEEAAPAARPPQRPSIRGTGPGPR